MTQIDLNKIDWPYVEHLQEGLEAARYSHWNSLLTFNGILIGAFSVLGALEKVNKWLVLGLILLSAISSALIIWNFSSFESRYNLLLKQATGKLPPTTSENKDERIKEREDESRLRLWRTRIAVGVLVAQAVVLLVIIYCLK